VIDRDRILVRDLRAIYALAAKDADEASGMTAGEPATASPTAGVTGALAPTAPGSSPLFPAVGGHLLGAMDDAIASDETSVSRPRELMRLCN